MTYFQLYVMTDIGSQKGVITIGERKDQKQETENTKKMKLWLGTVNRLSRY